MGGSTRAAWRPPSGHLVERGPHHAIPDLADRAGHIELTGLVLPRGQAEGLTDIA
jgi:hypothetical protein